MAIEVKNLCHIYGQDTIFEQYALKNVDLTIRDGEFIGLIGHTGSGKSTLTQHLNGLLKASSGDILYNGESIYREGFSMKELRSHVGLVFQYPEHQLFEVDVLTDVCFGPKNQGLSQEEAEARAREALALTGLDESFYKQSPFELSGGQKRRVAIAGVLAMKPEVLILDEPTAGLDPKGRDDILGLVARLHAEQGMTVILVSHSMEDVARYVSRLVVMNHGEKVFDGTPREVFRHYKELEAMGLAAPQITYVVHALRERGIPVDEDITTVEEARDAILALWKRPKGPAAAGRIRHVKRYYAGPVLPGGLGAPPDGSQDKAVWDPGIYRDAVHCGFYMGLWPGRPVFGSRHPPVQGAGEIYGARAEIHCDPAAHQRQLQPVPDAGNTDL